MAELIKTGICSYGMSGKLFHAPFLDAHPGFELSAIVERSKNESLKKYPHIKLYRSVEELIADDSLQLIIVNTPTHTHYEFAKAVIKAGRHIVLEKPMVVTVKEAEELVELATTNQVLLSVYQNRRYDGDFRAVKEVVDKGLLGDIVEVQVRYDRYRTGFSGKQHKEGDMPGSGVLYDLGAHLIDQALQLFGWPVAVFGDVFIMRSDVKAPDYFEVLLFYENRRIRLISSCLVREQLPAYIVYGKNGSFIQQRSDVQEQQLLAEAIPSLETWCEASSAPDGILHTEIDGEVIRKEVFSSPGNYMNYFHEIYLALTAQKPNPVPGSDGVKTIKIIEAAMQSVKEGKTINV